MKKQRIVLASVLKPVDDTRMFEKIGKSLSSVSDHEVFIIGYPSLSPPGYPLIQFIPHPHFNRLSWQRVLIPYITLKILYKVKPDILIVNTHELLIVAVLYRIFFGGKIIYDVQENYWRNILWTNTFPPIIKQLLAIWVRGKEILLSGLFHLFILAEKGFEKELKFFRNKFIVLENKSSLPTDLNRAKSTSMIKLLFSGTISESTGIFQVIDLTNKLYQLDQSVQLHIVGYCALPATLKKIRDIIKDKPYIELTGGDRLVPHPEIIAHLCNSDFGLVYYPSSRHTENRIPTKLYEYLSAQLPMIIQDYKPWLELCDPYPAAIAVQFNSAIDAATLLQKMKASLFYTVSPTNVWWSSEESKLQEAIRNILI